MSVRCANRNARLRSVAAGAATADDPSHGAAAAPRAPSSKYRRRVSRHYTPRAVQEHTEFLRSRIDELLDAVADQGRLEVVHDLAAQLPSRLTAELLG